MPADYYLILGVNSDATADDIRAAYRQRALELHPDRGRSETEPFQEVQEAYAVLSDPTRRATYDSKASPVRGVGRRPVPHPPSAEPLDPIRTGPSGFAARSLREDYEVFGPSPEAIFDRFRRNFAGPRAKGERPEPLGVEIVLSPREARRGGVVPLGVPVRKACSACHGAGHVGPFTCFRCAGSGTRTYEQRVWIRYPPGLHHDWKTTASLADLGIANFYLEIHFRIGHTEHLSR